MLGGNVHIVNVKALALAVARKETGLEVNADKTKHMVLSRDQKVGRNQNIQIDKSSF